MTGHDRRLDSWKEIAEYLGRDVRTAMRWSKTHGLPVRRVAGGRGRSVFAFTSEIDAWLAGRPFETPDAAPQPSDASASSRSSVSWRRSAIAAAVVMAGAIGFALWPAPADDVVSVAADRRAVTVIGTSGTPREVLRFDPDAGVVMPQRAADLADVDADGRREVLVGISYFQRARLPLRGGELLNLSPTGEVRWRFAFEDAIAFRDERFDGPWVIADWGVGSAASPARVAVAAHHSIWWASMVAVLDHTGRRISTFVNPGWIESMAWLDTRRLAVAGFNNARNAAMLAVIDTDVPESQAPGIEGTPFACVSCRGGAPLFYATFARSELNAITASRFSRSRVSLVGDRIVVGTTEAGEPEQGHAATGIYEFDSQLRLVRARFDDRYWDLHRQLEATGKITHASDRCPEREGPLGIHRWADGWNPVTYKSVGRLQ